MSAGVAPRARADERERLHADFIRLCEIESPSLEERRIADAVTAELEQVGVEVEEDASGAETGSSAGNLLARLPASAAGSTILLCAHLDTVPVTGPVEVVHRDERYENRHDAILGADNKAAVAALLAVARRLVREPAPVAVELLFTTCEERALAGAKAFDRSRLAAEFGFVFDHASPVGELILASPSYFRLEARFRGRAAHAGIRPEDGRSAVLAAARAVARMRLGRLDDETTANVGRVEGGSAANVVAEHCRLELEARGLDHDRATDVVTAMVDVLVDAAGETECDVETTVDEGFRGYRLTRGSPPVRVATAALEDLGIEPRPRSTGGGSDANVLVAAGLPCLNVANGTERNHQPDERVSAAALEAGLDLALGIVAASG